MENLRCIGCGAKFQNENKNEIGYTPKTIADADYCQRCFRLINHTEKPTVYSSNNEFKKIIDEISKKDCLIVYLMDYFDFSGSSVEYVEQRLKNKDYIIVGNKVDLIPKSIKMKKLEVWFNHQIKDKQLKPLKTMLISAKKKKNIDELIGVLEKERKSRDVYVIGATNTGKSTLINSIISAVMQERQQVITTSYFSSTTLDLIKIPFDKNSNLIDTPGIINENQMTNYLNKESLTVVVANQEIKPKTYNLNAGQTLFLTGLCQFNYIKGERTSFTVYVSNKIEIHRTKTEKADVLRQTHVSTEMLSIPNKEELENIKSFEKYKFTIIDNHMDIVIDGLGWVSVRKDENPIEVELIVPQKIRVSLRKSF